MQSQLNEKVEYLVDYVMKWCLWQFNSRAWDRENQNNNIIPKTTQILCGETATHSSAAEKCYWVEAMVLAKDFKEAFPWLGDMNQEEIKDLMQSFKDRIDYITITGSKNAEIHNPQY